MVRLSESKDIDRILALLVQVNNVHADLRADIFIKDRTKYTREALEEILKDASKPIFVSVDEEDVVKGYGFVQIISVEGEPNIRPHVEVYIDDICVDESCRHQGVATEIYKFIEGYAEGIGASSITLNVWEGNEAARKLYEAMGMKVRKTTMEKVL